MASTFCTKRFQYILIFVTIIIIAYYVLDEHIASMLDNDTSSLLVSPSYIIDCNDTNSLQAYHKSHQLYFANEIALHPELIGYSYANELQIRKKNFRTEMDLFTKIGDDLLSGNIETFKHLSRYYVHPSKYHEYTREHMVDKWQNEHKNHIDKSDLIGAHPSCRRWNANTFDGMQTYEIHFTHNCCTKYGGAHRSTAKLTAHFDHVLHYQYHNISSVFKEANKEIVDARRGAGFWIWKPWIILNTMINVANECDVICYCDTGSWWNNSAQPLFELASSIKYGVMVFSHLVSQWGETENSVNLTERFWSKRDAFLLLGVDINDIYDTVIRKATFSCYQVNPDSIHFVSEWLFHAMDERIITDRNIAFDLPNINNFHENRHDQTVMSLLSKKYGIPAFMDVSQYGFNDARRYGMHVLNWEFPWIVKHTRGKQ